MTDPMVEFVLARIAEREELAKRAAFGYGAEWTNETDDAEDWSVVHADGKRDMVSCEDGDVTKHIALNDPAHVLARCAADRAIVGLHSPAGSYLLGDDDGPRQFYCSTCGSGEPYEYPKPWPCETLRLLANADHPDFREEWKL